VDARRREPQTVDLRRREPQTVDSRRREPQTVDSRRREPQTVDGASDSGLATEGASDSGLATEGASESELATRGREYYAFLQQWAESPKVRHEYGGKYVLIFGARVVGVYTTRAGAESEQKRADDNGVCYALLHVAPPEKRPAGDEMVKKTCASLLALAEKSAANKYVKGACEITIDVDVLQLAKVLGVALQAIAVPMEVLIDHSLKYFLSVVGPT
jgi:hypothetical protein